MQKVPAVRPGLSDFVYVFISISGPALTAKVKVETKKVCFVIVHVVVTAVNIRLEIYLSIDNFIF